MPKHISKPKGSKIRRVTAEDAAMALDPRFAKMQTDPLYRLPSRKQARVVVDARFAHMLHDERFSSKAKVDRYGRRLIKPDGAKTGEGDGARVKGKEGLNRLYRVEEEQQHGERSDNESGDEEEGGVALISDDEVERELAHVERKHDPARDGGYEESSSSEEDTSDEEELDDVGNEVGIPQAEDVPEGEVSSRLAVVNLDWDNIRSIDLMAVLQSFTREVGRIERVSVYPSEFGKERLEREEIEGPPKELFAVDKMDEAKENFVGFNDSDEGSDEDERIRKSLVEENQGEDFDPDQLRRYQLERLRYYYAVVECSSSKCAQVIYQAVDGIEYLSTANYFDLRFIPDDTDFSEDTPRDTCDNVPTDYKPIEFATDALQHSKVKLTWDADDVTRKEAQKRAFSRAEIDENDLKAYLASGTSDEDDEDDPEPEIVDATEVNTQQAEEATTSVTKQLPSFGKKEAERQRMRKLLGLSSDPKPHESKDHRPVGDMQITFSTGLSGSNGGDVFENKPLPEVEETAVERYVRKERERKARRKEKMKARRQGTDGVTAKVEEKEEAKEDLGFDDPFFTEPANDQAAAKAARKEEKRKERAEREAEEAANATQRIELEQLIAENQDHGEAAVQHFDIDELRKADKVLRRKGKKTKLKAGEKAALEAKAKDDYKVDIEDPRFQGIFNDPKLAIDPSDPHFKATSGMQTLLEAGRKKRAREMEFYGEVLLEDKNKKLKQAGGTGGDDLNRLVQRVRGKLR